MGVVRPPLHAVHVSIMRLLLAAQQLKAPGRAQADPSSCQGSFLRLSEAADAVVTRACAAHMPGFGCVLMEHM